MIHLCATCGEELVSGQLRRLDEHAECYNRRHAELKEAIGVAQEHVFGHRRRLRNGRPPDIKAPDGYVLGGTRKVRRDGTILLGNTFYQCPTDWAGQWRSVHINGTHETLDVAPEHVHIYTARVDMPTQVYVAQPAAKADAQNRTINNLKRKGHWHVGG